MKRKLLLLLIFNLLILVSCSHEHTFYTDYVSNSTHHWHQSSCEHNVKGDEAPHEFGEWITITEPTEDNEGEKERKCLVCEYSEYENIPVIEHTHNYQEVEVVNPTCEKKGYITYECSCGETNMSELEALPHDIISYDAKNPTCLEFGYKAYEECKNCSYTTYEEIKAIGHDIIKHEQKNPTCTDAGHNAYEECKNCSYTTYQKIEPLGHDIISHDGKKPTCTESGYEAYEECKNCSYTTYEEVLPLGHDVIIVEGKLPTCYEIGYEEYEKCKNCNYSTYEEIKLTHEYYWDYVSIPTLYTEGKLVNKCLYCGKEEKELHLPNLNSIDYIIEYYDSIPTCTESGFGVYVYEVEDLRFEFYDEVLPIDHEIIKHEKLDPTCEQSGYEAYEECVNCSYNTYKYLEPKGHDYGNWVVSTIPTIDNKGEIIKVCSNDQNHIVNKELPILSIENYEYEIISNVTCLTAGKIIYKYSVENDKFEFTQDTKALGHDIINFEAKDATCEEVGYDAYEKCSRCNYSTYEEIEKLGHDIINFEEKEATCEEVGYAAYEKCKRCDYTTYEEKKALGHKYSSWELVITPTLNEKGSIRKICSNDNNHIEIKELPLLNEIDYKYTIIEVVSCLEEGLVSYQYEIDSETFTFEVVIDALGHDLCNYAEKDSTCLEPGHNAYEECSRCDYTTFIAKELLPHEEVVDEFIAASKTKTGLSEGKHCGLCEKILIPQETLYYLDVKTYNPEYGVVLEYESSNKAGEEITLRAIADSGRGFAGWYMNGRLVCESSEYKFTMPKYSDSLEARFTIYPNMDIWFGDVATKFESGTGTKNDPYIIKYANQLAHLADVVNSNSTKYDECYFKLIKSIDMNGYSWTPIGTYIDSDYCFEGNFDGNNNLIYNMKLGKISNCRYYGLFGYTSNSVISNLNFELFTAKITDLEITKEIFVGALVGYMYATYTGKYSISNIHLVNGDVDTNTKVSSNVGGIVGQAVTKSSALFENCTGQIDIKILSQAGAWAGSIAGYCGAPITGISGSGSIEIDAADEVHAGGLIGALNEETVLDEASYKGTITVNTTVSSVLSLTDVYVGGLVGSHEDITITDSIVECNFTVDAGDKGNTEVGGLIGSSSSSITTEIITSKVRGNIIIENAKVVNASGLSCNNSEVSHSSYSGTINVNAQSDVSVYGASNYSAFIVAVDSNITVNTLGDVYIGGVAKISAEICSYNGNIKASGENVHVGGIIGDGDLVKECIAIGSISVTASYKYQYAAVVGGLARGHNSNPQIINSITGMTIAIKLIEESATYKVGRFSTRYEVIENSYVKGFNDTVVNDENVSTDDMLMGPSILEEHLLSDKFFRDTLLWGTNWIYKIGSLPTLNV